MALAWKAGWVHALTSSNLVSSAVSPVPRFARGGLVLFRVGAMGVRTACSSWLVVIFRHQLKDFSDQQGS